MAAMAIKIEPRILEAAKNNSFVVLDGLYSWEEYVFFKEHFLQPTTLWPGVPKASGCLPS